MGQRWILEVNVILIFNWNFPIGDLKHDILRPRFKANTKSFGCIKSTEIYEDIPKIGIKGDTLTEKNEEVCGLNA